MSFFENTQKACGAWRENHGSPMMNLGTVLWHGGDFAFWSLLWTPRCWTAAAAEERTSKRLLKKNAPEGIVNGIDYSPVSVEKSQKVNEGRHSGGPLHRSARQRGEYDLCRRLVRCG